MRKDKLSLKTLAVLVVVLVVLSAMLAYLVLRKQERPGYVMHPTPFISLGYSTNYDELDIVEWPVITGQRMKFTYLTFQLKDQQGNVTTLKAKTVSLGEFTPENLKNDTEYQLYFYDYMEDGFMSAGDKFMVKAPADGYYILRIIYLMSTNLCQTELTKF